MPTFPQGAQDVVTPEAARASADGLAAAGQIAVDVEADSMHAFRARLCFVQLGTDEHIFLWDTLVPGVDAQLLNGLFGDATKTKYFHAAGGDLQFLSEAGVRVKGLFDTHRAATLLGLPKVGLADLVQERVGVALKKEHQQSDFSIRPLPPELREYIADDVRYLCEIGRQLEAACRAADIYEEVLLDCDRLADEATNRPEVATLNLKLPRGGLSPAQIALAETLADRLHHLRLQWAEQADVPLGRMLSNMALGAIAAKPPQNLRELSKAPGVRGSFVREHGEEVLALVKELSEKSVRGELTATPKTRGKDPKQRKREDALKDYRSKKAVERKVTPSVVLPNPLVEALAENPPRSLDDLRATPYFGEKRVSLYGAELIALLTS